MAQFEIFVTILKFLGAFLLMCVNDSDNVWGGWWWVFVCVVKIFKSLCVDRLLFCR